MSHSLERIMLPFPSVTHGKELHNFCLGLIESCTFTATDGLQVVALPENLLKQHCFDKTCVSINHPAIENSQSRYQST